MWCLLLSIVFACTRPLMHHFLPLPSSFYLDEEVAGEEEEINDDDIDNAAEDIAADDAPANDDINYATMLPKVKPIPTAKAAPKKESAAAAAKPSPPAAATAAAAAAATAIVATTTLGCAFRQIPAGFRWKLAKSHRQEKM